MKYAYIILALLFASGCNAKEPKELIEFLKLFRQGYTPSVADFYYFYSEHSEEEIAWELHECKKHGWKEPASKDTEGKNPCLKFMRKRYNDASSNSSNYLKWLKKYIKEDPKLKVISIKNNDKEKYKYYLVLTQISKSNILFRVAMGEEAASVLGRVKVMKINGSSTWDLFNKFLNEN
jgi:hypothetical protein